MKILLMLNILCTLSLTAHGQLDKLLIDTTTNLNQPHLLSKNEIKEDIELLLFTMRTGYGLYNHIDSALRINTENQLNEVTKNSDVSPDELCNSISLILSTLPDGHLVAISNQRYCHSDLNTRKPSVGRNYYFNTAGVDKCWKLQYVNEEKESIPILSIIRFPSPQSKEWEGFKEGIKQLLNYKNIIIDLRGNTGGNDKMGYDLIATLNGSGVPPVVEYFISKQTPAAYALLANGVTLQIRNLKKNKQPVPSDLYAYLLEFRENFNSAVEHKISDTDTLNFKGRLKGDAFLSKHFNGNIYILADAACGSSGETVLGGLKTLKNSTFIGENTAGVVHSRNNGKIVLPNSKIQVQMGTRFVKYLDNRFIEKIGYKPDVSVPKGTDALEFTLELIKKGN